MKTGMWQPGRNPVDIEHVFTTIHDPGWVDTELARIRAAGRIPLVTIEPWTFGDTPRLAREWGGRLAAKDPVYVRYMHEMNGNWYPWANDPDRFKREWWQFRDAMPPNVRMVWSPNVNYPGSPPLLRFWPSAERVDVIGLDGYARDGESPAELFRPTLEEVRRFSRYPPPVWITETAAPRGRKQARYATALRAFCDQHGIEACVWFNEDKAGKGPDERDWTLTRGAARAFLGA